MLISKFLTSSLLALSVATIVDPSLASDDVFEKRQKAKKDDGWEVVGKRAKRKEKALEREFRLEKEKEAIQKKAPQKSEQPKPEAQKVAQPKPTEQVKVGPVAKKVEQPAVVEKKGKTSKVKEDDGWQTVPIRTGVKPRVIERPKPAPRKKNVDKQLEAEKKRAKSERDWAEIKGDLLKRAEKKENQELVQQVDELLERLKKTHKFGVIKRGFPDYLTLMHYGPKQKYEVHCLAFNHLLALHDISGSEDDKPYLVSDLLHTLNEKSRAGVAARLMGVLLRGDLAGLKANYVKDFRKFNARVALEVLEMVFDSHQIKLLEQKDFGEAFNQLMDLLLNAGGTPRSVKDAQAYFQEIKGLAKYSTPKDLDMSVYKDRELAWKFRKEAGDIEMTPMIFNEVRELFDLRIHGYQGYVYFDERERGPLLFQILKICGLNEAQLADTSDVSRLVNIILEQDRARLEPVLSFLINNRAWVDQKPGVFDTRRKVEEIIQILLNIRDFGLDQSHWATVMTDSLRLKGVPNLRERVKERTETLKRRIPEGIRAQIAPDLWKMIVEEIEKMRGCGFYAYSSDNNGQVYTKELIEFIGEEFPESDMVKAFHCMRGILRRADNKKEVVQKLSNGVISDGSQLLVLEATNAYLEGNPDRLKTLSRFLEFFPYLGNHSEWFEEIAAVVFQPQHGTAFEKLMSWYAQRAEKTQEAIREFWTAELTKPKQNVRLASIILQTRWQLPKELQYLIPVAAQHKRIEVMQRMQSEDPRVARVAMEDVLRDHNYRAYGVIDRATDDVYQYALYMESKLTDCPLNPYSVLEHHRKAAQEVVDYSTIRTKSVSVKGKRYFSTGDMFKGIRVSQVTFSQLPKYSKTFLRDMKDLVLKKDPSLSEDILGAFTGGFLEHWLSVTGEPEAIVPPTSAKLIAIVAYIQGLSDVEADEGEFTPQEQEYATFMRHAQACETNKTEVIHKSYVALPVEARLPLMMTADDSSEDYIRQVFERPFLDLVEDLLSCEKRFLRGLCGNQRVRNASHIETFVKNLLMVDIPLYTKLERDLYTVNCVPAVLLEYTRAGVLDTLFSNYIKLEELVDAAGEALNRDMQDPKSPMRIRVQEFMEMKQTKAELLFDEKTQVTTIAKHSVYELLHLLGFLKVEN